MDLKLRLKRFWPNRTHESSVLKDAICALGFHRWHLIEVKAISPALKSNYCRWCSEIRVQLSPAIKRVTAIIMRNNIHVQLGAEVIRTLRNDPRSELQRHSTVVRCQRRLGPPLSRHA
jgi:hypothetical protein